MGSQAAGSDGPASGPPLPVAAPLIGNLGQEYVQVTLSTNDPVTAIADIQARGAMKDPRCQPLIGLLDQLGLSRSESHHFVVQRAVETLLAKIPTVPPERLRHLLDETFPYIGIRELKAIPLAILDCLRPVPATFLKQLAQDKDLFWELPLGVQQQAWEVDRKLLHSHALPLIAAYTYETATWMEGLNMGDTNDTDERGSSMPLMPHLARRNLRRGSAALSRLVAMVGKSPMIYKGIIELCTARFRDVDSMYVGTKDAALCALRSQLLMSLHDSGQTGICAGDSCHKLAWTLDACMRDGFIDARRLKELKTFFSKYSVASLPDRRLKQTAKGVLHPTKLAKRKRTRGRDNGRENVADVYFDVDHADTDGSVISGVSGISAAAVGVSFWEEDAESTGLPGSAIVEDPLRELGAAAMIIRDPTALNLILRQIIRCLERCVSEQLVPKSDQELMFLTQLISLGVEAREMLRSNVFRMSGPHGEVVGTLYPMIADLIVDAELATELPPEAPAPEELVNMMVRSEISRRVVQMYVLRRLQAKDLLSSCRVLVPISVCLNRLSEKAIPEFAGFGFSLSRRLSSLLTQGILHIKDPIWNLAVEGILVRLVDADTKVHEEVLRLLLLAAGPAGSAQLEAKDVARLLTITLANSQQSREAYANRNAELAALPPFPWGGEGLGGYDDEMVDEERYSYYGQTGLSIAAEERGADGVRGTYALFVKHVPGLNAELAPELFAYLQG